MQTSSNLPFLCKRGHLTPTRRCAKCQKWERLAKQDIPIAEIERRVEINECGDLSGRPPNTCRRGHITFQKRCAKCQKWDRLARKGVPESEILQRLDVDERTGIRQEPAVIERIPLQQKQLVRDKKNDHSEKQSEVIHCVQRAREAVQQFVTENKLSRAARAKGEQALMHVELALVCAKQALREKE